MSKKVAFGAKPKGGKAADAWVQSREAEEAEEPMKRLTIDVPEDLHKQLKVAAASQGVKMADLVRGWIKEGLKTLNH